MKAKQTSLEYINDLQNNMIINYIKAGYYYKDWIMECEHLDDVVIYIRNYCLTLTVSVGEDKNNEREVEVFHVIGITDPDGDNVEIGAELETLIENEL